MILLISDLHCQFQLVDLQIAHAEGELGAAVEAVVVLGDFGLFAPELARFFGRQHRRFARPLYYIEGNHEDFGQLARLSAAYAGQATHLARGAVREIGGFRCLALGGASYMDSSSTPLGAEIRDQDIELCLAHPPDSVDVILSHDCPAGIGVPNSPGFQHYGPTGFARGAELAARYRPRLWVFGHHHKWFAAQAGSTRYYGLAESWTGYGLLAPDGEFTVVHHPQPRQVSFGRRLLGGLLFPR